MNNIKVRAILNKNLILRSGYIETIHENIDKFLNGKEMDKPWIFTRGNIKIMKDLNSLLNAIKIVVCQRIRDMDKLAIWTSIAFRFVCYKKPVNILGLNIKPLTNIMTGMKRELRKLKDLWHEQFYLR